MQGAGCSSYVCRAGVVWCWRLQCQESRNVRLITEVGMCAPVGGDNSGGDVYGALVIDGYGVY